MNDRARLNNEVTKVLYDYIIKYGRFGVRPHQLTKALGLDEAVVVSGLQSWRNRAKFNCVAVILNGRGMERDGEN